MGRHSFHGKMKGKVSEKSGLKRGGHLFHGKMKRKVSKKKRKENGY